MRNFVQLTRWHQDRRYYSAGEPVYINKTFVCQIEAFSARVIPDAETAKLPVTERPWETATRIYFNTGNDEEPLSLAVCESLETVVALLEE